MAGQAWLIFCQHQQEQSPLGNSGGVGKGEECERRHAGEAGLEMEDSRVEPKEDEPVWKSTAMSLCEGGDTWRVLAIKND